MKQKNIQNDNITETGKKMIVETIVDSKKNGIFVLTMVLLFWCVLLFASPVMAAEKTCMVSIPVTVKLAGNESDSQTQKNPVFTVVMEAADGRIDLPVPEQNQIQIGTDGSGTFDSILYTAPGDYEYQIRQLIGSDPNIIYDVTDYEVTVRVVNTQSGGLEAEVWAIQPGEGEKQSQIVFENKRRNPSTSGSVENPAKMPVKTSSKVSQNAPKTGDMQNPALYVIVIIIAAGVAVSVGLYRKYKKKDDL